MRLYGGVYCSAGTRKPARLFASFDNGARHCVCTRQFSTLYVLLPAMKKSQYLNELIAVMSAADKRKFTLYCLRYKRTKNINLMLFDILKAQREPLDDALLRERIADDAVRRNLARYKNRLYNAILRCLATDENVLANMRGENNDGIIINDLMAVSVLIAKGLYYQAHDMLLRLEEEIQQHYSFTIKLLYYERLTTTLMLLWRQEYSDTVHSQFINALERQQHISAVHNNYLAYHTLTYNISSYTNYKTKDKWRYFKEVQELLDHPLLSDESQALSERALSTLLQIKMMAYNYLENREKFYHYARRSQEVYSKLIAKQPPSEQGDIEFYNGLRWYIYACVHNEKYTEMQQALQKLYNKTRTTQYPTTVLIDLVLMELYICVVRWDFAGGVALYRRTDAALIQAMSKKDMAFYMSMAAMCFYVERDIPNALELMGAVAYDIDSAYFSGIHYIRIRLFMIILYHDAGYAALVKSNCRSLLRWLNRYELSNPIERIIVQLFWKLLRARTQEQTQALYRAARDQLYKLNDDQQLAEELRHALFIPYLESKLANRPLRDFLEVRNDNPSDQ